MANELNIKNGLITTTISATTYQNLPDNVSGKYLPLSGGTVTGNTVFSSGLTANTISANTLTITNNINSINRTLYDSIGLDSIRWENRYLLATDATPTVDWENGLLAGLGGTTSFDWGQRLMYDSGPNLVIDWQNLILYDGGTNVVLDWQNKIMTGMTNIQSSTISATTFNLSGSQVETSWTSYVPTWTASVTNPVIGNGTIEGYYKVVGKTCFVRGNIVMGTTTTFGSGEWYVSMPFTAVNADAILMTSNLLDNGTAWYNATLNGARAGFNTKAPIQYQTTGGTANDVNATQPFTWVSTDRFIWNGSYEIA